MKPDCYKCVHQGGVAGSAHSSCSHPNIGQPFLAMLMFMNGCPVLGVRANAHGIARSWFSWPVDFDPLWLESCDGFEEENEDQQG